MRQFTTEEYQILLEGLKQLLADYQEAEIWDYEKLEKRYLHYGMCNYISFQIIYTNTFKMLFSSFVMPEKKLFNQYLYKTPFSYMHKNARLYSLGITDRINWLEQKISEIKNILNESITQN